jgi:hypothetical protein
LYLLPFLLVVAGTVAAIVAIVSGVQSYSDTIEGFARVPVGQTKTVQIDGTGGYTVFYEPGASSTDSLSSQDPQPPLQIVGPGGDTIPLHDYSNFATYSSSGYVGFAIQTFNVPQAGPYQVTSAGGLGGVVAIGRSPFDKITAGVLLGLAFGFGGFVVALVVLIVLMISRGRSKRRIRSAASGGYPQQPVWAGGPQPGYQQYPPAAPPSYPPAASPPPPAGGFGPPPAPPAPPPPSQDDTTPGWGQPGR